MTTLCVASLSKDCGRWLTWVCYAMSDLHSPVTSRGWQAVLCVCSGSSSEIRGSSRTWTPLFLSIRHSSPYIMEYASSIWSPSYAVHRYRLERVHRKFLRYVAYKSGISTDEVNFTALLQRCHLDTLERRRCSSDLVLFFKLLNT